jgi:hypothetical protein
VRPKITGPKIIESGECVVLVGVVKSLPVSIECEEHSPVEAMPIDPLLVR